MKRPPAPVTLTLMAISVLLATATFDQAEAPASSPSTATSDLMLIGTLSPLVSTYSNATTLHELWRMRVPETMQRMIRANTINVELWFKRPKFVRVKSTLCEFTCDGREYQVYLKSSKQYMKKSAPSRFDLNWFQGVPQLYLPLPSPSMYLLTAPPDLTGDPLIYSGDLAPRRFERTPKQDCVIRKQPTHAYLVEFDGRIGIPACQLFLNDGNRSCVRIATSRPTANGVVWESWADLLKLEADGSVNERLFEIRPPPGARLVDQIDLKGIPFGPPPHRKRR